MSPAIAKEIYPPGNVGSDTVQLNGAALGTICPLLGNKPDTRGHVVSARYSGSYRKLSCPVV